MILILTSKHFCLFKFNLQRSFHLDSLQPGCDGPQHEHWQVTFVVCYQWHCITEQSQNIPLKIPHIWRTYFSHRQQARNRDGVGRWELRVRIILLCRLASGVLSNIDHQKKKTNIDHTALYRPHIDHKSSLKSSYLHVLRHNPTSQEIHVKQGAS